MFVAVQQVKVDIQKTITCLKSTITMYMIVLTILNNNNKNCKVTHCEHIVTLPLNERPTKTNKKVYD